MKLLILITLLYSSVSFAGGFYSCYTQLTEESQQGAPEFKVTIEGNSANISIYPPQDGVNQQLESLATLNKVSTPTKAVIYSGQYVFEDEVVTFKFVQFSLNEDASVAVLYSSHDSQPQWAMALECRFEPEEELYK